jgi:hypothetical protein
MKMVLNIAHTPQTDTHWQGRVPTTIPPKVWTREYHCRLRACRQMPAIYEIQVRNTTPSVSGYWFTTENQHEKFALCYNTAYITVHNSTAPQSEQKVRTRGGAVRGVSHYRVDECVVHELEHAFHLVLQLPLLHARVLQHVLQHMVLPRQTALLRLQLEDSSLLCLKLRQSARRNRET